MHDLSVFDETFDQNITATYSLSIQVLPDGFSFCILDTVRHKFIGLKHFYFGKDIPDDFLFEALNGLIMGEEVLTKRYKEVKVLYYTNRSTIIPVPLYAEDAKEVYFKTNHQLGEKEILLSNAYKNVDIYQVFAMYKPIYELFSKTYSKLSIYNQLYPVIEENLIKYKNKLVEPKLFVHINTAFFDIVLLGDNQLKFSNTFSYSCDDDFMYFLMYVYDQLGLDAEKTELILSGDIDLENDLFKRITKFVKQMTLSRKSPFFSYSYHFNGVKDHYYTSLYNIHKCE